MESENGDCSSGVEATLDPKWLVNPKDIFLGPKIGEGAHGKVYMGKYKNVDVAVKVINRGTKADQISRREARFAREVEMLARVQHMNLVKFIGACQHPVLVIITELLPGGTLRQYLMKMRPRRLDIRVAIGFALNIARGMECLHSHGIIHRDLKPENLLLTGDHKTVKLVDFGLAREETITEMMTAETGTYRWMAPELYSTVTLKDGEKKHYNHKVDTYSFGVVFWELIQNRVPFEGMSSLQAAYAAAFKNARPSVANMPQDLAQVVTSCWSENPNARPDFSEIIKMLQHYLSTIPSSPRFSFSSRFHRSELSTLPPESPGTNSLMAASRDDEETRRNQIEGKRKWLCFCIDECY